MHVRAILLCACLALTACGGVGGGSAGPSLPSPPTAPPATGIIVPPAGEIYLGAFSNPQHSSPSDAVTIAQFEQQVGRKMALTLHYYPWTSTFPGTNEAADLKNGRVPVIAWNCGAPNAQVAAGTQDANIAAHADALRAYGSPIFIRYMWEMNLADTANGRTQCYDPVSDEPNGFFSPTQYIAAWRHIRAIFAAHGATNVIWLWNPSGDAPNPALPFYPGAAEVDWVGIDEYDRTNVPFAQTYTIYPVLAPLGKPIMIAETGASPAKQPAFLTAAATALPTDFPLVKGFVYFSSSGKIDWQLSPAGIAAFAVLAANSYFSAFAP